LKLLMPTDWDVPRDLTAFQREWDKAIGLRYPHLSGFGSPKAQRDRATAAIVYKV
jgi:hypothetical protein